MNRSRKLAGAKRRDRKAPSENAHKLYNSRRWRQSSKAFREAKLCAMCEAAHKITPAQHTDHIIPHNGDPRLFWSVENWQPLCKLCHDHKTHREQAGYIVNWRPIDGRYVVTGLPCTGKTTWWKEHFDYPCRLGPGGLRVWDMDMEAKGLGFTAYPRPPHELAILQGKRDEFLSSLHPPWVYVTTWTNDGFRVAQQHKAQLIECVLPEAERRRRAAIRRITV